MILDGRDTSELNGTLSRAWFAMQGFVIVRAFNEHGRMDRELDNSLTESAGVTWRGVYGWPIAGDDNYTLGRALGVVAEGLELGAWADYEKPPHAALPSHGELRDYLAGIRSVGVVAGFYSNRSEYPDDPALDVFPWWYANPSGNPEPRHPTIVQYGIVAGVDADRADAGELAALNPQPIPPTTPEDDVLVVVFGQTTNKVQTACLVAGGRAIATWTEGPYVFGCPHAGTDYVTAHPGTPLVLVTPADLARVTTP